MTRITTIMYHFLPVLIFRLFFFLIQEYLILFFNTRILDTCTWLWLMESEQVTPVDSIKDVVRSSVKVPEFDKHLKKAGGHISRNIVEITIKMKTIVRKPLMIKITKLCLRNLDNYYLSLSISICSCLSISIYHWNSHYIGGDTKDIFLWGLYYSIQES